MAGVLVVSRTKPPVRAPMAVGKYGTNPGRCAGNWPTTVNIMDSVVVPAGLAAGDYVLSFRWDCELYGTFDMIPNHLFCVNSLSLFTSFVALTRRVTYPMVYRAPGRIRTQTNACCPIF